ncbi:MAG: hypothetical protein JNM34_13180, partial [Chthonomonadaceae bacterium]|nr:hypothetical protein [Chthonomonadaceae bacterium]
LFEQLRKQGYLKVRVDGEIVEMKERMQLDRYKIHDIELVIDRLIVQPDAQARLSQSIQKSLQTGKDLMFLLDADKNTVTQYSKQLMCAETGLSYEEPSPNTFSFNSPYGACPKCKGLGSVYQVNMNEVIPDNTKSINDGGITPLGGERESWTFNQATILAKKHKIPLNTAIKDIPSKQLNILLYGNEEGIISYNNEEAESYHNKVAEHQYEGIVNMLLRWFNETTSEAIRDWAEEYMQLST